MPTVPELPYCVSVLVFLKNAEGKFLMLHRMKKPNKDFWTPIGGKLEMSRGESPFECAIRETQEEANFTITNKDLHLFSIIAEQNYEASNHWLLFLFNCTKPIDHLPQDFDEGSFEYYTREQIDTLPLPETDRQGLWATYDNYKDSFVALKADCNPAKNLNIIVEESY